MDELGRIFGDLVRMVPHGPIGEAEFIFDTSVLPRVPARLSTERATLQTSYRDYNGWYRADLLTLLVEPKAARELGVFLLACVFHEPERVVLKLPTGSDIREVIYRSRFSDSAPVGLREVPKSFGYFPGHVLKHPWLNETDLQKLPLLALSSPDECPQTAEDWNRRDTVFIESSAVGTVRLAELLLNAGCPSNTVREVDLEGDAGFRGVAPLSAELRIVLPGSPIWTSRPGEKCSDQ